MTAQADAARENNFNLLRVIAAFTVLYSHSYALTDGHGSTEPFRSFLGISLGGLAVDLFFVVSGFLVCGSLLRRQSAWDFVKGRAYRIYPALIVMVSLTVVLLGPWLTSLSLTDYWADKSTLKYFVKNATLVDGVSYKLPGVFENNPYPLAVNGSLWTLPEEVRMYATLLGVWVLVSLLRLPREGAVRLGVILLALAVVAWRCYEVISGQQNGADARLMGMFFAGASLRVIWSPSLLRWRYFAVCSGLLLASAVSEKVFALAVTVLLPYWVLFLAYAPAGRVREYNRCGDYSYGLYLYAFPIQQALAALIPGIGLGPMIVLATIITLAFAIPSWHLVEKPALERLRRRAAPAVTLPPGAQESS